MKVIILCISLFITLNSVAQGDEKKILSVCLGCHSIEQNRIGPRLKNIVGRKIAGLKDYNYSKALSKKGIKNQVWTESLLDEWLKNPSAFAKGTKMGVKIIDKDKRKKIINYLKTLK